MNVTLLVTTWDNIKAGAVLREVYRDGTTPPFGDAVIVAVKSDHNGQTLVQMARPHVRIDSGTCWQTMESFEVPGSRLVGKESIYRTVCSEKGVPVSVEQ